MQTKKVHLYHDNALSRQLYFCTLSNVLERVYILSASMFEIIWFYAIICFKKIVRNICCSYV